MVDYFSKVKSSLQNSGAGWSHSYATQDSDAIRRFELRSGDHWRAADGAKERSEISSGEKLRFNQIYTLSYQLLIEPGTKNAQDNVKIGQLHGTPDAKDSGDLGPVFALQLDGEKMKVVVRYDARAVTTDRVEDRFIYTDKADLVRGHWYDMKIVFRLDPQGAGLVQVWRDGQELVHYAGPLGYNDAIGPYWKEGIYRAGGSSNVTLAVDFKNTSLSLGAPPAESQHPSDTVAAPGAPLGAAAVLVGAREVSINLGGRDAAPLSTAPFEGGGTPEALELDSLQMAFTAVGGASSWNALDELSRTGASKTASPALDALQAIHPTEPLIGGIMGGFSMDPFFSPL